MAASLGCSSSDVERYDGAYGHHHWARVGFDHDDVNDVAQYVVEMTGNGGACSGVLIGPDQVLTAAHCVRALSRDPERCPVNMIFRGNEVTVAFDFQERLDPPVQIGGPALPMHSGPVTHAREVIAGFDGFMANAMDSTVCMTPKPTDAVVLRLDDPIGLERGWARMRETIPVTGALAPTIHHPHIMQPKKVVLGRLLPNTLGDPLLHARMLLPLAGLEASSNEPVTNGSSGAPLFDPDGYIIATERGGPTCPDRMGTCGEYVTVQTRTSSFQARGLPNGARAFVRFPRRETALALFGHIDRASGGLVTPATHGTRGLGQRSHAEAIVQRVNGGFITGGSASVTPMAVSSPVLIAYDAAGVEDPMFGFAGIRELLMPGMSMASVRGLAIQSVMGKERILAVGGAVSEADPDSSGIFITRRLESGQQDTAFAMGSADLRGEFLRPVLPGLRNAVATSVALDSRGRIVVAGSGWADGLIGGRPVSRPFVMRLDPDGVPDPSCHGATGAFVWQQLWPAGDGRQLVADVIVRDMALDGDDNIILGGVAHIGGLRRRPWVGRINGTTCTPDTVFGTITTPGGSVIAGTGIVQLDPVSFLGEPGHLWIESLAIDRGRILGAGSLAKYDALRGIYAGQMVVMGFDAETGALDSSYGNLGIGTISPEGRWDEVAKDLSVLPDGSVVVLGRSFQFTEEAPVNGSMDVHRIAEGTLNPAGRMPRHSALNLRTSTDEWANAMLRTATGDIFFAGVSLEPPPLPILIER